MKKIFLPLLALVGMVAGFTLCSCGGGGGDNDGPARAIAGMCFQDVTYFTPSFSIEFGSASGPNTVIATLNYGGKEVYTGFFTVDFARNLGNGTYEYQGALTSFSTDVLDSNEFKALLGVDETGSIQKLTRFQILFRLSEGCRKGNSVDGEYMLVGSYVATEGATPSKFEDDYPQGAKFDITQGEFKPTK